MTLFPELVTQLDWLMRNSRGVVGLRTDGEIMPWREVMDLYVPAYRAPQADRYRREEMT